VVLIIDEAQNLKPSVLEEIRMLSNLETESEKLLQIIFLGQPELKKKLALPKLEQLRQRIAVFYHLKPLTTAETKEYIIHRLKIASESHRTYFTEGALDMVCHFAKGVPRLINQVCDSALLSGYIFEVETIDEKIVKEVVQESPMIQITGSASKEKENIWDYLEDDTANVIIP
jgi:general secretion pathway protein A